MKKFIIFGLGVILSLFVIINFFNKLKESTYCKYVDNVTHSFIKSVKKDYDLSATRKGGSFMENIKEVYLSFDTYNKKYNIDQARVLMIDCVEDYLHRINKDEKVRPFLDHYPFTEKRVELSIYFYESKLKKVSNDYIAGVHLVNNTLFYSVYDEEKGMYINVYEEPYQEAVHIVQEGK